MSVESFIANRYLKSTRHSFSVTLLKWIALIGVALGVFSLMVVLSVMRGFEKDFEAKILGFQAPVIIESRGARAEDLPELTSLQEHYVLISGGESRLEGELVIESTFGTTSGARVRGVTGAIEEITGLGNLQIVDGGADLKGEVGDLPGIVLGTELAAQLQVHPDFDDEVRLVFPFGEVTPSGEIRPNVRRFRVTGLFDSGFYEYDSKFAIIDRTLTQRLFGDYARASLALYMKDAMKSESLKESLQKEYPDAAWTVSTWKERNQRLFQVLMLERIGMFLLLLMIILIASFNIFALLSMFVLEKVRDMAVLRSVGFKIAVVQRVFLWQAGRIGLRGTLIGGFLGLFVCLWLQIFPYRLPPSYYVEFLPISIDPVATVLILLMGPVISLLAGFYPARRSTRYGIAEVLRYE